jgi:hypothetical protein
MPQIFQTTLYLFKELDIHVRNRLTFAHRRKRLKDWSMKSRREALLVKNGFENINVVNWSNNIFFDGHIPLKLVDMEPPDRWSYMRYDYDRTNVVVSYNYEKEDPHIYLKIEPHRACWEQTELSKYLAIHGERILEYAHKLVWRLIQEMESLPYSTFEAAYNELMADNNTLYTQSGYQKDYDLRRINDDDRTSDED